MTSRLGSLANSNPPNTGRLRAFSHCVLLHLTVNLRFSSQPELVLPYFPSLLAEHSGGQQLSDRKYRQHGYQDRDQRSESKPQQSPRPSGDMTYGPRAIQMAPTHTISRCANAA